MKKIFTLIVLLVLLLSMTMPVYAEGEEGESGPVDDSTSAEEAMPVEGEESPVPEIPAERQLPLVVDNAVLLTDEQVSGLIARLEAISELYKCEVAIVTVPWMEEGMTAAELAHDYFDYNGFGYGENDDGILFLISIEERDAAISTYGIAIEVFNETKQDKIWDAMMPYLSEDRWYEAFTAFADTSESILKAENSINPIGFAIAIIIGLLVAFLVTLKMKSSLKTVRKQVAAQAYMAPGSLNIRNGRESFLYRNVVKTKRVEKELAKSAGSMISSSGRSHGGSSRRF